MAPGAYDQIVEHGRRKLTGRHLPGEHMEPKAFGLVAARVDGDVATITEVVALVGNYRWNPVDVEYLDAVVAGLAVPSETPLSQRGWLADPREVMRADECFARAGQTMFGAYHMHRVRWPGDERRDRCTALDRHLAAGSGLWTLILSLVDPSRPILRAFFEGDNQREAPVTVA